MARKSWLNVLVRVLPLPLGLLLSGVLVWGASNADWSGNTANSGNLWASGTFGLTNASRVPMFRVENMKPGESGSNCIVITSSAEMPAKLKLFGVSPNWPTNFQSFINLKIEAGTGGSFGNCTGFRPFDLAFDGTLDTFVAIHTNFRSGVGPWIMPGKPPNPISFRFSWQFSPEAPNTAQGFTSNEVTFSWEAHESP